MVINMNIRDIARLANVTPGTVSKVLNNYPDISEATRQHVLRIIEENQYDPGTNSRASKSAGAAQIGLVVEGVYNALYNSLEEMLSIRLHNSGYTILSFHDNYYIQDKQEKFQELTAYVERHKLCGLVYIGGNFECVAPGQIELLACPTIFVNTVLPLHTGHTAYSSVQVNHFETAYAQMSYLIQKGHKEICTLISSGADNSVYGLRVKGYRAALNEHHLEHNFNHVLESDYRYAKAYSSLSKHLQQHPEITAVCCVADIIAPAVIKAIHDLGRIPGKDIEIISFDGIEVMNYCIPTVTTFEQPLTELMEHTYHLLLGLINKEREHQHITFQTRLIKNESC